MVDQAGSCCHTWLVSSKAPRGGWLHRLIRLQQLLAQLCQVSCQAVDQLAGLLHAQLRAAACVPLHQLLGRLSGFGNNCIQLQAC